MSAARLRPLLALVALSGCPKPGDRVLATADGPPKAVIRLHERKEKADCDEQGLRRLKCLFQPPLSRDCVYLELGEHEASPTEDPCASSASYRTWLASHAVPAKLSVEPGGERLAWDVDEGWRVAYVLGDGLIEASGASGVTSLPDGGIDWAHAPELTAPAMGYLFWHAAEPQRAVLAARLIADAGQDGIIEMLRAGSPVDEDWQPLFESLDGGFRTTAVEMMVERVGDGDEAATEWFEEHPELTPADYYQRMTAMAEQSAAQLDLSGVERWLPMALKRRDPKAGQLACRMLDQLAIDQAWRDPSTAASQSDLLLIAIGAQGVKCPVVTPVLMREPCPVDLRCEPPAPDAGSSADDDEDDDGPDPEDEVYDVEAEGDDTTWPLCSPAQSVAAIAKWSGDYDDRTLAMGRMAALRAQGPLPRAFELANDRRTYTLNHQALDGGEAETDYDETPCNAPMRRLAELMCRLRPEQTELTIDGCQLHIDDAHRVVTTTWPALTDGGTP